MRETLVVVGLIVLGFGLRSSRQALPRKLGALVFVVASAVLFYYWIGRWWGALAGLLPWLMLPWVELLTRIRRMRLPVDNRLKHRTPPNPDFFPNAPEAEAGMAEEGFEHVDDCGWEWAGMQQFFKLYWHPEERAVAAICLCEQSEVAFAFLTVTSRDDEGRLWRTTNFPFSPTLKCPPDVRWNHVPCERNSFPEVLADHQAFLRRCRVRHDSLMVPDPDEVEAGIEKEMKDQISHNLEAGIIRLQDDEHFTYSFRGLLFLWWQFVKDMVRLC